MPSSLDGLSVYIATPTTNGQFPLQTLTSYLDTQEACMGHGIKVDFGFVSCSLVHHARTLLANIFIEKQEFSRLFWIDSDIQWSPLDFLKVLTHTRKHDCVVGVYPTRAEPTRYYVKFTRPEDDPDDDGLVEIDGTGLGFACMTRGLVERIAESVPKLVYGSGPKAMPAIFRCDSNDGDARGEDYAFWADVQAAGYKIMADCTVSLGHVGTKVYTCPAFKSRP